MRLKYLLFLVFMVCSVSAVSAQEETPAPNVCSLETVDGQVQIAGDMSACSLDDINDMYKFLEEQVAGGFDVVELPTPILVGESGAWHVEIYYPATDQIKKWAMELGNVTVDPVTWSQPFNVDIAGYSSKNGFEYDATQGQNSLCEQTAACSLILNPSSFRLVTADGAIPAIGWKCDVADYVGCAVSIWNVGDAGNLQARFENGFTISGQYFNGGPLVDSTGTAVEPAQEAMPIAMNALMSLVVHNMVGGDENNVNVGGNCSQDAGCDGVQLTVVVVSGNQMLLKATTIYHKPN